MSAPVKVRPATYADAAGIAAIYAGSNVPFDDPAECAVHTNHRLLEGFLIDVALIGRRVVGHAEWIVSDEPPPYRRHLYLGMLEAHPKYRGRGAGRALVEAGMAHAHHHSCPLVKTVSAKDARGFYKKCGLKRSGRVAAGSASLRPRAMPTGWRRCRAVPRAVVATLPMRLGWAQACSAHMWSMCNRPIRLVGEEPDRHPCARRTDAQAYVQVRYCPHAGSTGLVIAWAPHATSLRPLCTVAMALANDLPVSKLLLMTSVEDRDRLAAVCDRRPTSGPDDQIWSRPVP